MADKMSGLQKAAVLLIALGPEKSASIFRYLKADERADNHGSLVRRQIRQDHRDRLRMFILNKVQNLACVCFAHKLERTYLQRRGQLCDYLLCTDYRLAGSGKTGRCSEAYCDDGPDIAGCH